MICLLIVNFVFVIAPVTLKFARLLIVVIYYRLRRRMGYVSPPPVSPRSAGHDCHEGFYYKPENTVEAHRLANNYMVISLLKESLMIGKYFH